MDTREGCKGEGREDGEGVMSEGVMGDDGDLPPYFSRVSCAKILMELHLHDVCGLYIHCVCVCGLYTVCVCGLYTVCVYWPAYCVCVWETMCGCAGGPLCAGAPAEGR